MVEKLRMAFEATGLSSSEAAAIADKFKMEVYAKNEYLIHPGRIASKLYFILEGSVILGQMAGDQAITRHLAIENEFITSLRGFDSQEATDEFLQASTATTVYALLRKDFDHLTALYPAALRMYQSFVAQTLFRCQQRITDLISMDAKSYYDQIAEKNPELIQRMTQYHLASYIGIEPQSLSRLRSPRSDSQKA